ncbi:MAG: dual OB domain-containing protein [Terriglobales bacterium]
MAYTKRIVCLANSFKKGGSCVAGRELVGTGLGQWIRPVGDRPTAEVRASEFGELKLLDIVDVPLLRAEPRYHQTENHVIDASQPWVKVGELPWPRLAEMIDRPASLWINRDRTNGPGLYDCVSETEGLTLDTSLVLIKPDNFSVEVSPHYYTRKRTWRADFVYNGTNYNVSLTDPIATRKYSVDGSYPLNDVYICVSLTEPWVKDNNRCHKLVAAIFTNPPL